MGLLTAISSWRGLGLGLTIASVLLFVISALLVPWLLGKLPSDYFLKPRAHSDSRSVGVRRVLRNILGVLLVLLGVAMLVMPGQGVLTILLGLVLIDFPGKHRLILQIVKRKPVRRGLNWLRRRGNRPPFEFEKSTK